MRRTVQLIVCMIVVGFAAPRTTSADPIAITSGTITLPGNFLPAPTTLNGTDGVRAFTFTNGVISTDAIIFPYTSCEPCTTQVSIAIHAVIGVSGDVTYGSESYKVGPGILDTDGDLNLDVLGTPIQLPTTVNNELRTFTAPCEHHRLSGGPLASDPKNRVGQGIGSLRRRRQSASCNARRNSTI